MVDDQVRSVESGLTVKLAKVDVTWGFFVSTLDESLRLTAADGTDSKEILAMVVVGREVKTES